MLTLTITGKELYDDETNTFVPPVSKTIQLEHSLISISKWESKWCHPFIGKDNLTVEETIDYIRCMTLTQNVDPQVYNDLTNSDIETVKKYIDAPMTATTIRIKQSNKREIVTSEVIYGCMITHNIPFECQKWHLNRLITLINVCSIKNAPQEKQSTQDIMSRNRALNASRRQAMMSKG